MLDLALVELLDLLALAEHRRVVADDVACCATQLVCVVLKQKRMWKDVACDAAVVVVVVVGFVDDFAK